MSIFVVEGRRGTHLSVETLWKNRKEDSSLAKLIKWAKLHLLHEINVICVVADQLDE